MSGRSFHSVFMVASCAAAALGCYLVSLRVASERAALESVETEIVMAQRDIRLLQTEIGTRGRLAQLERWNVKVLALSAPSADQFLDGGFALAKMVTPRHKVDLEAPVVLAAAPDNGPKPQLAADPGAAAEEGVSARDMMHVASLKRPSRTIDEAPRKPAPQRAIEVQPTDKPAKVTVSSKPADKLPVPSKAAAKIISSAKPAIKVAATPVKKASIAKAKTATSAKRKVAAVDPLAPIVSSSSAKTKKVASSAPYGAGKENGSKQ